MSTSPTAPNTSQPLQVSALFYDPESLRVSHKIKMIFYDVVSIVAIVAFLALSIVAIYYSGAFFQYVFPVTGGLFKPFLEIIYEPLKSSADSHREKMLFEEAVIKALSNYQKFPSSHLELEYTIITSKNLNPDTRANLGINPITKLTPILARHKVLQDMINSINEKIYLFFESPPTNGGRNFLTLNNQIDTASSQEEKLKLRYERAKFLMFRQKLELEAKHLAIQQAFCTYLLENPFHHGDFNRLVTSHQGSSALVQLLEERFGEGSLLTFNATGKDLSTSTLNDIERESAIKLLILGVKHLKKINERSHNSLPQKIQEIANKSSEDAELKELISFQDSDWVFISYKIANIYESLPADTKENMREEIVIRQMKFNPYIAPFLAKMRNSRISHKFSENENIALAKTVLLNFKYLPDDKKPDAEFLTEAEKSFLQNFNGTIQSLYFNPEFYKIADKLSRLGS